jgi:hypothetical protein
MAALLATLLRRRSAEGSSAQPTLPAVLKQTVMLRHDAAYPRIRGLCRSVGRACLC